MLFCFGIMVSDSNPSKAFWLWICFALHRSSAFALHPGAKRVRESLKVRFWVSHSEIAARLSAVNKNA